MALGLETCRRSIMYVRKGVVGICALVITACEDTTVRINRSLGIGGVACGGAGRGTERKRHGNSELTDLAPPAGGRPGEARSWSLENKVWVCCGKE